MGGHHSSFIIIIKKVKNERAWVLPSLGIQRNNRVGSGHHDCLKFGKRIEEKGDRVGWGPII